MPRFRSSVLVAALAAALLAACGGHSAPPDPPPSQASTAQNWSCSTPPPTSRQHVSTPIPADIVGTGKHTVILSNQSNEYLCSWLPFSTKLVRHGYRVVLYDYTNGPTNDLAALVGYLRSHGSTSVALIGASEGAKGSIIAGSTLDPPPDAVVSLSAEAELHGVPVAASAGRLHTPTLFVTADQDPYGSTNATKGFYRDAPATDKKLLVVPGEAHGTALLQNHGVTKKVITFLDAHTD